MHSAQTLDQIINYWSFEQRKIGGCDFPPVNLFHRSIHLFCQLTRQWESYLEGPDPLWCWSYLILNGVSYGMVGGDDLEVHVEITQFGINHMCYGVVAAGEFKQKPPIFNRGLQQFEDWQIKFSVPELEICDP